MSLTDYAQVLPGYETLKKNWGWTVAFGVLLAIAGGFAWALSCFALPQA